MKTRQTRHAGRSRPRSRSAPAPRRAQEVVAEAPSFPAAAGDDPGAGVQSVVREDRQGIRRQDQVPDLSGDAARRHAAAALRPGDATAWPTSCGRCRRTRRAASSSRRCSSCRSWRRTPRSGSPALWDFVQKNSLDEFKGVKVLGAAPARRLAAALHEQAGEDPRGAEGTQGARADAHRHQVPDGARRRAGADAGAAGAGVAVEGRDRRRDGAVGGRAGDQAAGDHEVSPRHGAPACRGCRTRSS